MKCDVAARMLGQGANIEHTPYFTLPQLYERSHQLVHGASHGIQRRWQIENTTYRVPASDLIPPSSTRHQNLIFGRPANSIQLRHHHINVQSSLRRRVINFSTPFSITYLPFSFSACGACGEGSAWNLFLGSKTGNSSRRGRISHQDVSPRVHVKVQFIDFFTIKVSNFSRRRPKQRRRSRLRVLTFLLGLEPHFEV
ncbi:hypothetical protein C8R43DRAFT_957922 [Mycena crocata]|nr:hypothetical protein C8R43DRAFT_957922 [Mycena crocata]